MTSATPGFRWNPRLIEAARALNANRLDVAERLLKDHLKGDPYDVAAMRMLAELAARIGRLRDAEALLRRALEIAPRFTAARANLAVVLGRAGRAAEALQLLDEILAAEPEFIGHWNLKAATLGRLGDFDEAIRLYRAVLDRRPEAAQVWVSFGHMLKTVGRLEDGIDAYRRALSINPSLGEAWFSLANLKTVAFSDEDMAAMRAALQDESGSEEDRWHIGFALGKAMHDAGNPDAAFALFAEANRLRRARHKFDADRLDQRVDRAIAAFGREQFAQGGACESADPIFIVGLPRAGSTLVEQILASHPLVEGIAELPDMPAIVRSIEGYPETAAGMTDEARRAAGLDYLRRASVQRKTDRSHFIDKLPNNWLFAPFILTILPKAKIIDVRRHPMACCFSNFRQHFARGQDFAYDLDDLGRYYRAYVRLMAHLDEAAPGRVHRLVYERLVDDPEDEVRAMLHYCRLPFDPACLAPHRTERAIRTPSSEQVRRPIHRDAVEEWKAYETHLAPLAAALGEDLLATYPFAPPALRPSDQVERGRNES